LEHYRYSGMRLNNLASLLRYQGDAAGRSLFVRIPGEVARESTMISPGIPIRSRSAFQDDFALHCQINFCRARSAERNTRSRCGNRISPLIRRLGSEDPERRARDEMALKVEGIVNGGMFAEEASGGAN
jgi:hypothetical protein